MKFLKFYNWCWDPFSSVFILKIKLVYKQVWVSTIGILFITKLVFMRLQNRKKITGPSCTDIQTQYNARNQYIILNQKSWKSK